MSFPSFHVSSEVVSHLNASGPDTSGNYSVFGLSATAASIQTDVDHANKYLNSIVPGLTSTDLRYGSAQLAALAIACVGTLVTASGGPALSAFDYRLGEDIFIIRLCCESSLHGCHLVSFRWKQLIIWRMSQLLVMLLGPRGILLMMLVRSFRRDFLLRFCEYSQVER